MADALADPLSHDDDTAPRRLGGILDRAARRTRARPIAGAVCAARTGRKAIGHHDHRRLRVAGTWSLDRDEATGRSTVTWRGSSALKFPWGSYDHHEQLVYHVDDAHPADAAAEGDGESVETLKDRVLTYRGHLRFTSDATTFHYAYTRELLRDGTVVRTRSWHEDIPRDLQ
jgi:hypothetical protein